MTTRNDPQKKSYKITVKLQELVGNMICEGDFNILLSDSFVSKEVRKQHTFQNHMNWFVQQIKQNELPLIKRTFSKREIVLVRYGIGIGSEIIADRPSIIYKASKHTQGEDIICIPLTSVGEQKIADAFDVLVRTSSDTNIYKNSYARTRQLKVVSLKRIGKSIGKITDPIIKVAINGAVKKMMAVDSE